LSTVAPSGDISEGKALSYDQIVKQIGSLESKLDGLMSIIKEVNVKLEQEQTARKKAALIALRRSLASKRANVVAPMPAAVPKLEAIKPKSEEEEAKRKKLEELKSRLEEVKTKMEEKRKLREASASVSPTGKGNVGAVQEEKSVLNDIVGAEAMPPYFKEILGASDQFKRLGLLSA
jgi:DNA repair exonuclease SbcCD ATPase subunit